MREDQPVSKAEGGTVVPPSARRWTERLLTMKVTPPVIVGFIALLAVFCLAAAFVGSLVHHLQRR